MHALWEQYGRRLTVLAFALLGHVLLVSALLQAPIPPGHVAVDSIALLNLAPAETVPLAVGDPGVSARLRVPRPRGGRPKAVDIPSVPPLGGPVPPVDWGLAQQRTAESRGRETWTQLSQHCRDAEALHIHPPDCQRSIASEPWEPEERHFGMQGPLPYMRVGPCVVGLGFWGCAL